MSDGKQAETRDVGFFLIYFWLHWVFVALHSLSLVGVSGGPLFIAAHGLLIAVASLLVEHRL